jgi:hypothetical protein
MQADGRCWVTDDCSPPSSFPLANYAAFFEGRRADDAEPLYRESIGRQTDGYWAMTTCPLVVCGRGVAAFGRSLYPVLSAKLVRGRSLGTNQCQHDWWFILGQHLVFFSFCNSPTRFDCRQNQVRNNKTIPGVMK